MKWNQEDLFFAGFFSALNSSGEVFFDGDILRYVEFEDFKIYSSKIKCNDVMVLIATKNCSDSVANLLLHKITEKYFDANISRINPNQADSGNVEKQFLKYLDEMINQKKTGKYYEEQLRIRTPRLKSRLKDSEDKSDSKGEIMSLKRQITELELKLGSISMMGRTIGHELNNVLSAILGNVTLAKMDSDQISEQYESLDESEIACSRARELTSRLLTISKNISKNTEIYQTIVKKDDDKSLNCVEIKAEEEIISGQGRVLVLDDKTSIRSTTKKMITRLGYSVETASNLEESLEKYKESMKNNNKFDVVILDLSELGGLGGFGSLIWRKIDPKINAIVSSGYANDPIFKQFKQHGFHGALKKPYNISQLSKALYEVLNEKYISAS